MNKIAILGTGAWGTALAIQVARAGCAVTLWGRDPPTVETLRTSRTTSRLPGVALPGSIELVEDLPTDADILLLAVPIQHLTALLTRIASGPALVACAKGIETGTLRLPLEAVAALHPAAAMAILTGPNFAAEIAAGLPAAAVVASTDAVLRRSLIDRLASPAFRLYGNDDPVSAQVGGAAKNVVAIAAGAVIGAHLGENARAALVTRGLAEIARLATALGGRAETVAGLSGLGDLLLTCGSERSRNFALGLAIGHGATCADALRAARGVVEGVATAPALVARAARAGLELPNCEAVSELLAGRLTLAGAMQRLLARPRRDE
jgi:glycerol-3-phosphate dehydrogenase (NAD(P)+)